MKPGTLVRYKSARLAGEASATIHDTGLVMKADPVLYSICKIQWMNGHVGWCSVRQLEEVT